MKHFFSVFLFSLISFNFSAQSKVQNSADILHELKKLNVLGNALYLAAHPDDENTRLISRLENERLVRTAYLSLTRGDGGQNLLGSEKGDAMGVLRTQELLEARKIDGGEQYFSRAVDFGYSKTAQETLEIWDKDKILADVVWVIRKFKPDVIITRFPPDDRGGHGHHTASSMLAEEAFKLAADPKAFPEQLKYVETWQSKRILWDIYWWNKEVREEALKSGNILESNIGAYNALLGQSYSEIASESRSQHKSQGFGTLKSRGNRLEYLKHTFGDVAKNDLFEGINTSWERVQAGAEIGNKLNQIITDYQIDHPSQSIQDLVELYALMKKRSGNFYVDQKIKELKKIIKAAAGIYAEAVTEKYSYAPNEEINGNFNFILRSDIPYKIHQISPKVEKEIGDLKIFANNEILSFPFSLKGKEEISQPYWLYGEHFGVFQVDDQQKIGKAENEPIATFQYSLSFPPNQEKITFEEPIDYKWSERVDGELHRDVIITPEVTANLSQDVYLTINQEKLSIELLVEAHQSGKNGAVSLTLPEGWTAQPEQIELSFQRSGQQIPVSFEVSPPKTANQGEVKVLFDGQPLRSLKEIEYDHIRPQTFFPRAEAKLVKMQLQSKVNRIGYIEGSGDEVAKNLKSIGFKVESFQAEDLPLMDLSQFETIIVGIRTYNINDAMVNGNDILNKYVEQGGTVIVQYNTNRGLIADKIGPYPFQLSRNRVTKEEAEPNFLQPDHPLLNSPNNLSEADFHGWVQERGLYFAGEWDDHYETVIAWNDPGEEPQAGSILVADYGKGKFIYTGISFFRQLPAGVPGAFRMLSNMISYGK